MESLEEVNASEDPEMIKRKRGAIQEMMTSIEKTIGRLLARSAGKFDHGKIPKLRVQAEQESLKKNKKDFEIIHEAYYMYGMDTEDIEEETPKFQEQVHLYKDLDAKIWKSLQLYADYEESYLIYRAVLPDPALAKKEA
jgi:hypothetical protein